MALYTHASHVDAPLADVWEFHSRLSGLEALTPGFVNLRVERVVGPGGADDPDVLEVGSEVALSMRPFGVGPRQRWRSRIVEREYDEARGEAYFVDEMLEGPFPKWTHTHRFVAESLGTRMQDRVVWGLPGGPVGEVAAHLGVIGLEPLFRYRHHRTRELLEG